MKTAVSITDVLLAAILIVLLIAAFSDNVSL